jgi:hypothetical protein
MFDRAIRVGYDKNIEHAVPSKKMLAIAIDRLELTKTPDGRVRFIPKAKKKQIELPLANQLSDSRAFPRPISHPTQQPIANDARSDACQSQWNVGATLIRSGMHAVAEINPESLIHLSSRG